MWLLAFFCRWENGTDTERLSKLLFHQCSGPWIFPFKVSSGRQISAAFASGTRPNHLNYFSFCTGDLQTGTRVSSQAAKPLGQGRMERRLEWQVSAPHPLAGAKKRSGKPAKEVAVCTQIPTCSFGLQPDQESFQTGEGQALTFMRCLMIYRCFLLHYNNWANVYWELASTVLSCFEFFLLAHIYLFIWK